MSTEQQKRPSIIATEDQKLKITTEEIINPGETKNIDNIRQLLYKLERTPIFVNRLDYFGNSIPIGAFCNAIAFIIWGFQTCKVLNNEPFLNGLIIIFGGLGQITAGLLEYLKIRSYSALLYLTLGFFCFSYFLIGTDNFKIANIILGDHEEMAFFFGAWFIIILPLIVASIKINVFFLAHTGCTCLFFFFRWVGEVSEKEELIKYPSAIFQLIAGFISLYIFAYQLIDEEIKSELLPTIALNPQNEIDYNIVNAPHLQTPQ